MLENALGNGLEVDHSGAHHGAVTVVGGARVHVVVLVRKATHRRNFLAVNLVLLVRILVQRPCLVVP